MVAIKRTEPMTEITGGSNVRQLRIPTARKLKWYRHTGIRDPGSKRLIPAKTFCGGDLCKSADRKRAVSAVRSAMAGDDDDYDRCAALRIPQGYKWRPGTTVSANASESPPAPSPTALILISFKCKLFAYRKSTLKYLKMRCSISLIASSKAERSRKARSPVSIFD